MPYDDIVLEAEDKMEKAVSVLAEELRGVRTGRASAALVDGLKVEAYGTLNPLKSLAAALRKLGKEPEAKLLEEKAAELLKKD